MLAASYLLFAQKNACIYYHSWWVQHCLTSMERTVQLTVLTYIKPHFSLFRHFSAFQTCQDLSKNYLRVSIVYTGNTMYLCTWPRSIKSDRTSYLELAHTILTSCIRWINDSPKYMLIPSVPQPVPSSYEMVTGLYKPPFCLNRSKIKLWICSQFRKPVSFLVLV